MTTSQTEVDFTEDFEQSWQTVCIFTQRLARRWKEAFGRVEARRLSAFCILARAMQKVLGHGVVSVSISHKACAKER